MGTRYIRRKECTKCHEFQPVNQFYWRSTGFTRQSWCKQCTIAHVKKRKEERDARIKADAGGRGQ